MIKPYPLKFQPEFKERVWGGRALTQFGFHLPEGRIGEGWMIGDHPHGTTKVVNGDLAGLGLDEVCGQYGKQWFGSRGLFGRNGRFPLLIKLLDCNDDLSVQVHPTDIYAGLPQGEWGKTEMWYILHARLGAKVIYGLKKGIDRQAMARAIEEGCIMETLQAVPVQSGDTLYIPAGTVHALCAGVVVVEIQQNSDTTYRLYDYNRLGLDDKPRELHIEHSLNVIAYEGAGATCMSTNNAIANEWLVLARSPYFYVEKGIVVKPWSLCTTAVSFVVLIVCEGTGTLKTANEEISFTAGECLLLPANLGHYTLDGNCTILRSVIP